MNWYDLEPDELKRRIAALEGLSTVAKRTVATAPEEWPDVVLEDILDAEYLSEE